MKKMMMALGCANLNAVAPTRMANGILWYMRNLAVFGSSVRRRESIFLFTIDAVHPIWYNFARLVKTIPERD